MGEVITYYTIGGASDNSRQVVINLQTDWGPTWFQVASVNPAEYGVLSAALMLSYGSKEDIRVDYVPTPLHEVVGVGFGPGYLTPRVCPLTQNPGKP